MTRIWNDKIFKIIFVIFIISIIYSITYYGIRSSRYNSPNGGIWISSGKLLYFNLNEYEYWSFLFIPAMYVDYFINKIPICIHYKSDIVFSVGYKND